MKVFLTGATGFIGQPLTQALLARGWDVVALVRNPNSAQARNLLKSGVRCTTGDVTERDSMRAGMRGADLVIHNAGFHEYGVSRDGRKQMHAVNVTGTDNVLGLARELDIPRCVYVSSTVYFGATGSEARDETYRRQTPCHSYYERTKVEAHVIAQEHARRGLPLVIVCPNAVVGANDYAPFGYFLRLYLNGLMAPYGWAPDMIACHVHVDDASEGIALAAEKGRIGETYILAGEPICLRELVELWMTRPGGMKVRVYVPKWLAKLTFAPLEPLQRLLGLPAVVSRETISASTSMNFSGAKAQRELGWRFRPARAMWHDIIDEELALLANRKGRSLLARLRPVEPGIETAPTSVCAET